MRGPLRALTLVVGLATVTTACGRFGFRSIDVGAPDAGDAGSTLDARLTSLDAPFSTDTAPPTAVGLDARDASEAPDAPEPLDAPTADDAYAADDAAMSDAPPALDAREELDAAVTSMPDAFVRLDAFDPPDAHVVPMPDAYVVPTPDAYVVPMRDAYVVPMPDAYVVPMPDAYVVPLVSATFPTSAATTCSFGFCAPLDAGGGGMFFRASDYLEETVIFGRDSISELTLAIRMDDLTGTCAIGMDHAFEVSVNGVVVGGYGWRPGADPAGNRDIAETYSFAAIPADPGFAYTIRITATTTVCSGGSSWNWFPDGTAFAR